jgi:hypothetical protein
MGVLRVKTGVAFDRIDPAGFRLLGALDRIVRGQPFDLVITCGTDSHPAADPHSLGRAYDVRTHNLTPSQAQFVLREVLLDLQEGECDAPLEVSIGLATSRFYGQLERPGEPGEHLHFQQRRGTQYP